MTQAPTGILTLVFTDIEGSSELAERFRNAFEPVRSEHFRLLREAATRWRGFEVETAGDSVFLVFERPSDAVQFALEAQRSLAQNRWKSLLPELTDLRVRIGMHTGEPVVGEDQGRPSYQGPITNRAARVSAAAHGGQILVSDATRLLAESDLRGEVTFFGLGTHRLKGVGEERLWQVCHSSVRTDFPPINTLNPERHNLPLPPTPYIGRDKEIQGWTNLLRDTPTRLLTFVGPGGMGKTRTALYLAELLIDDFPDGVWWINLEEAQTDEMMIPRVAYYLRLQPEGEQPLEEQLHLYLRERELLLVLDNTERIPNAGAITNRLLKAAPRVKCIVTTQKDPELGVGQTVYIDSLAPADAERLFIERARARSDQFEVTAENAEDIRLLCERVQGVPLAIELAASRIVSATPRRILDRIDSWLDLLKASDPALPERQRALRAAMDWSYALLAEQERLVLAQLSVFAGWFTIDAAEMVCECFDVFDSTTHLVHHSLLRSVTEVAAQEKRFTMLEWVRRYAAEKLKELPDSGRSVNQRHAEYFLGFAEERTAVLRTSREPAALDELEREFENLRVGMLWARNAGQGALWARLGLALYEVVRRRGFRAEGRKLVGTTDEAIRTISNSDFPLLAAVLYYLASSAHDAGELATARREAEASLAHWRDLADTLRVADTLNLLGLITRDEGDREGARRLFEEALRLVPEQQRWRRSILLHNLGLLAADQGERDEAWRLYSQALEGRIRAGDVRGEAETLTNLGVLAEAAGDFNRARHFACDALACYRALGVIDRQYVAIALNNLGEAEVRDRKWQSAVGLFTHAERFFRQTDAPQAYLDVVVGNLRGVSDVLGTEAVAQYRAEAERERWEDLVEGLQNRPDAPTPAARVVPSPAIAPRWCAGRGERQPGAIADRPARSPPPTEPGDGPTVK